MLRIAPSASTNDCTCASTGPYVARASAAAVSSATCVRRLRGMVMRLQDAVERAKAFTEDFTAPAWADTSRTALRVAVSNASASSGMPWQTVARGSKVALALPECASFTTITEVQ